MNTSTGVYWFWGIHGKALLSITCSRISLRPKSTESCSGMCKYLARETRHNGWNLQWLLRRLEKLQIPVSEKGQDSLCWPQRHALIISACVLRQPHYSSGGLWTRCPIPGPHCLCPHPPGGWASTSSGCWPNAHTALCTGVHTLKYNQFTTRAHSTPHRIVLCLRVRTES